MTDTQTFDLGTDLTERETALVKALLLLLRFYKSCELIATSEEDGALVTIKATEPHPDGKMQPLA